MHNSQYSISPSHHKTLDVLADVKKFDKMKSPDLIKYCKLAKAYDCSSEAEVADFLRNRYRWDTYSRLNDIKTAWNSLKPMANVLKAEGYGEGPITESIENDDLSVFKVTSIPIIIKNNCWDKRSIICEIDDPYLSLTGDLGAIGRLGTTSDIISIDIKGRQYSGLLTNGPTVIILNEVPNIGVKPFSSHGRVEILTNEYCYLHFDKDIMVNMSGLYTGDADPSDSEILYGSQESSKLVSLSRKAPKKDDSDVDEIDVDESSSVDGNIEKKRKMPKISTITRRKIKAGKSIKKRKK